MRLGGTIGRRRLLAAGGAAFAAGAAGLSTADAARDGPAPGGAVAAAGGGLARAAARCGVLFGSAFDTEALDHPAYGELIRQNSAHTGNLNSFKYDWLRSKGPSADFAGAERLLAFATERGLPFTAAVLVWNDYPPAWLKSKSLAELRYLFDAHIDETMQRFAGRVAAWVVVNEPFAPWDREPGGWRTGPWYTAFGPDYVARAFRRARAADGRARLILNEAFCERRDLVGAAVRPALLALVERIKHAGVPLDTVGLQGHLQLQHGGFDHADYADLMRRLAAEGVDIEITELDVDDSAMKGTADRRDAEVARHYEEFLAAVLQVPQLRGVTTWGLSDRFTWYHEVAAKESPLYPRKPRPLPFDEALRPKPAYFAIERAFLAAARRRR